MLKGVSVNWIQGVTVRPSKDRLSMYTGHIVMACKMVEWWGMWNCEVCIFLFVPCLHLVKLRIIILNSIQARALDTLKRPAGRKCFRNVVYDDWLASFKALRWAAYRSWFAEYSFRSFAPGKSLYLEIFLLSTQNSSWFWLMTMLLPGQIQFHRFRKRSWT